MHMMSSWNSSNVMVSPLVGTIWALTQHGGPPSHMAAVVASSASIQKWMPCPVLAMPEDTTWYDTFTLMTPGINNNKIEKNYFEIAIIGVGVSLAIKAVLEKHNISGKIILLGTPGPF